MTVNRVLLTSHFLRLPITLEEMNLFTLFGIVVASMLILIYILLFLIAIYVYVRVRLIREKSARNPEAKPVFV